VYKRNDVDGKTEWKLLGGPIYGKTENDFLATHGSLSMSTDGAVIDVGSCFHDKNTGYVAVYRWNEISQSWTQVGDDLTGEKQNERFGYFVNVKGDGTVLSVACQKNTSETDPSIYRGVIKMYHWNGLTLQWDQLGKEVYSENESEKISCVSLSNSGFVLAHGVPEHSSGQNNSNGHVRIFSLFNF
jgi:hypothetical protein